MIQLRDRLNLAVKISYFPFENPQKVTKMFDGTISYAPEKLRSENENDDGMNKHLKFLTLYDLFQKCSFEIDQCIPNEKLQHLYQNMTVTQSGYTINCQVDVQQLF